MAWTSVADRDFNSEKVLQRGSSNLTKFFFTADNEK